MICHIFRSPKKQEIYLYLVDKNGSDELDEQLKNVFGEPEFVMVINLAKRENLARVDIGQVKADLKDKGYYLQMPPPPVNLLKDINK